MVGVTGSIPVVPTTLRPSGYAWRSRARPKRSVSGVAEQSESEDGLALARELRLGEPPNTLSKRSERRLSRRSPEGRRRTGFRATRGAAALRPKRSVSGEAERERRRTGHSASHHPFASLSVAISRNLPRWILMPLALSVTGKASTRKMRAGTLYPAR